MSKTATLAEVDFLQRALASRDKAARTGVYESVIEVHGTLGQG